MAFTIQLFLICYGGFFALFLGAGHLFTKRQFQAKIITAALFFSISMIEFGSAYYHSGMQKEFIHVILFDIPFGFCLGPLLFLNYESILKNQRPLEIKSLFHFIPAVATFAFFIIYATKSPEFKIAHLELAHINRWSLEPWVFIISLLYLFMAVHIAIYTVIFIFKSHELWNKNTFSREPLAFPLFIFITGSIFVFLLSILSLVFDSKDFNLSISASVTALLLWFFLLEKRFPDILPILQQEVEKIKYERSHLATLNIDNIVLNLENLMVQKKIYTYEDLDLKKLAKMLHITPHQLSELLNNRLKKKFNDYVNQFRIELAKELLVNYPDKTVLSIAYEVGFNSQSTFYDVFLKITSITPATYRKEHS